MTAQQTPLDARGPATHVAPDETRWMLVLDQLEADLAQVEQALERGEEVPESEWVEPAGLGPAPAALQERMQGLATRVVEARQQVQGQLTELRGELSEVDRRRQAGVAYGTEVGSTA